MKKTRKLHSHPKNSPMAEAFHRHHRLYPIAEKSALGRGLLETVTYYLRPHVVSRSAHFVAQLRAKAQAEGALEFARSELSKSNVADMDRRRFAF